MLGLFNGKAKAAKEAARLATMAASIRPRITGVDGHGELIATATRPVYQFERMADVSPAVHAADMELVRQILALDADAA